MDRDVVVRLVQTIFEFANELEKEKTRIHEAVTSIKVMDEDGTLSIPYLKETIRKRSERIDVLSDTAKRYEITCQVYWEQGLFESNQKPKIEHFTYVLENYRKVVVSFFEFVRSYENYRPKNAEDIRKQVLSILSKKKFVLDGSFEGDFSTWVGVYARPADKPPYLDPVNAEEAELQNMYRDEDGFARDFSEWFEWEIINGTVVEK
ncbi:hypothetical protein CUS80_00255 [Enterococcus faecium]|uniref:hypothetical protein n=1 Tax=Enterococcus faecium TaxID=1352 RepID=UPI000CF32B52|nr:hypothetical protein [Enterococcus faecium]PQG48404.1 hypothetical protein CUS80_00255 [Enterococcus faecium]